MYRIKNFTKNDDVRILDTLGPFTVIEYLRDLSVSPLSAQAGKCRAAPYLPECPGGKTL